MSDPEVADKLMQTLEFVDQIQKAVRSAFELILDLQSRVAALESKGKSEDGQASQGV